jgi:hypothetical protein
MINATKIFVYTLIIILALYYLAKILYNLQVNQTDKSINVILMFLILVSVVTIIGVALSYNIHPHVENIRPSIGNKGRKGFRGKTGKRSKCDIKCMDNACYYKIMDHITNVYNVWLKIKRRPLIGTGEYIKNTFLKKKVKEMCDSQLLNNLIELHGAHKLDKKDNPHDKTICDIYSDCGAYDYIFQLWTEWILTILKYDKGKEFLETEYMTDNDFINLITDNDIKQPNDTREWNFNTGSSIFNVLNSEESLELSEPKDYKFLNFKKFYLSQGVPDAHNYRISEHISDSRKKEIKSKIKSPFEVIQEYDAWYWGANPLSVPQFVNKCDIETKNYNFKGKIKIKLSNDYEEIWDSSEARQISGSWSVSGDVSYSNTYKPYLPLGNVDVKIYRPRDFFDNGEKNLDFRSYKPVGDVIVTSDEAEQGKDDTTEHFPRYLEKSFNSYPNKNKTSGPKRLTILVSGDTKHPEGFQRIYTRNRTEGFQKHNLTFTIWRPIPPRGYVSLGDIISNDVSGVAPDKSIVVCIPESATKNFHGDINNIYTTDTPIDRNTATFGFNVKRNDTDTLDSVSIFRMENSNDIPLKINGKLNENNPLDKYRENGIIDKYFKSYNTFRCSGGTTNLLYSLDKDKLYDDSEEINVKSDSIKKRKKHGNKYSILKLYE